MQATVTAITSEGRIYVKVRRAYYQDQIDTHKDPCTDLKVGDKIEVKRVVNSPYVYRVKKA